ncbi:aspartate 1-decarboxylase [Pleomorphochaeta sp. DL1XJH-081]|jgi:aspartate 1-decarboxylase|uniref:aspartate 1-decarboxylase n=1 Tax=Pleomorphochaeta sp. DL1XJH-081 TaxID=3409690 RepID=UPI003BB763D6
MIIEVLKSKLHQATVTGANINYEGSISIDPFLYKKAGMFLHEKVDILNMNNGARFSTYIINGKESEICLNGAAARLVVAGDKVIIVAYTHIESKDAESWQPKIVILGESNSIKENIPKA